MGVWGWVGVAVMASHCAVLAQIWAPTETTETTQRGSAPPMPLKPPTCPIPLKSLKPNSLALPPL
ncbi:hypothetical protein B484DRAFT_453709 [Ochromonadaceae sp. CCMP2298]|nr:hypothetical protein B484DRAFT_453709 [Ochromonadaceae sp. CCMP2298]